MRRIGVLDGQLEAAQARVLHGSARNQLAATRAGEERRARARARPRVSPSDVDESRARCSDEARERETLWRRVRECDAREAKLLARHAALRHADEPAGLVTAPAPAPAELAPAPPVRAPSPDVVVPTATRRRSTSDGRGDTVQASSTPAPRRSASVDAVARREILGRGSHVGGEGASADARAALGEASRALGQRGERLSRLQQRSEQLAADADAFAEMARSLNRKPEKRGWFS